jgi:hypothetical protein
MLNGVIAGWSCERYRQFFRSRFSSGSSLLRMALLMQGENLPQVMCSQVSKEGKMQTNSSNADQDARTFLQGLRASLIVLFLVFTNVITGMAEDKVVSNKQPLSFGKDQTIIDLNKVVWEPLTGEGIPPGPEIATLRGSLAAGGGEVVVRLPANYTFPNHSHISDELIVWIKGNFTYIAEDGTATDLSGQTFISLPGGVPHSVKCGKEPCVFYLRYSRPFDYHIHPAPMSKK